MNRIRKSNRPAAAALVVLLPLCITLFIPCPSRADMAAEIEHLFVYIATSGCTFNRNGDHHNSSDAGEHLRKKYGHTKRWVKTSEDFIRITATKSSITGQPYTVICDGVETPTAQWLADELARFRKN